MVIVSSSHWREASVFVRDYFFMFGPMLLFIPFGIQKKAFTIPSIFPLLLFFSPIILFYIGPLLGIDKWRFANAIPFLWGGILAAIGIGRIGRWIGGKSKGFASFSVVLLVILVIAIGMPKSFLYFDRETVPVNRDQIYIPKSGMDVLAYMDTIASEGDILLSFPKTGVIVPAMSRVKGFLSLSYFTPNVKSYRYDEKLSQTIAFYKSNYSVDQAKTFLTTNNITYILIGWEEKKYSNDISKLYKSLVRLEYENDGFKLYRRI